MKMMVFIFSVLIGFLLLNTGDPFTCMIKWALKEESVRNNGREMDGPHMS